MRSCSTWLYAFPLVLILAGCESSPAPDNTPKAPSTPPTVKGTYPAMLEQQISRLNRMSVGISRVKDQYNAALDSGRSFTCDFSMDDIGLESETIVEGPTLEAYRSKHAGDIRTLLRSNPKVRDLEATERRLNRKVAALEQTLKK